MSMIKQKIEKFIREIPPLPKSVKECIENLESDDLVKAAVSASKDPAFSHYLLGLVNKPIFGFQKEIKDIHQVFGILGAKKAHQIVSAYYTTLILPKKWRVFSLNNSDFQTLQSSLIYNWNKILEYEKYGDLHITSAVSLIPASFVVCEKIFEESIDEVRLLKEQKNISYDEILYKLSGLKIFDIFMMICKEWELSEKSLELISYLNKKIEDNSIFSKLAKYLHLLIFYEISKPLYIEAGLNDFIEFDVEFVQEIYQNFMDIVESK